MKRNMVTIGLVILALFVGGLAVNLAIPENEVQAAMVEPVATPDEYMLALDNETGLPVRAIVFSLDGLTCIALPNGAMECACPCDTDNCEIVPVFVPDNLPDRVPDTPADSSTSIPPVETPSDGDTDTPPTVVPDDSDDNIPSDGGDNDTLPDDNDSGDNSHNRCNQGRGNGPEGCDPGNSNHNQDSNDEGAVNRGGNPTPNRNGDNGNNGKAKGKDKDK